MTTRAATAKSTLAAIEDSRDKILSSGRLILVAITDCAIGQVVPPNWLAQAFASRVLIWPLSRGIRSWDEVFEKPSPKHYSLTTRRHRALKLSPRIARAIFELVRNDKRIAIGKMFWSEVGLCAGCSATVAEEVYRDDLRCGIGRSVKQVRKELSILAAASSLVAEPTPLPFSDDLLAWISAVSEVPIEDVLAWHAAEAQWAAQAGGCIRFSPDQKLFPLGEMTPGISKKVAGREKRRG